MLLGHINLGLSLLGEVRPLLHADLMTKLPGSVLCCVDQSCVSIASIRVHRGGAGRVGSDRSNVSPLASSIVTCRRTHSQVGPDILQDGLKHPTKGFVIGESLRTMIHKTIRSIISNPIWVMHHQSTPHCMTVWLYASPIPSWPTSSPSSGHLSSCA